MFVFAIILALAAATALIFSFKAKFTQTVEAGADEEGAFGSRYNGYKKKVPDTKPNLIARLIAGGLALVVALLTFFSMSYTQQAGEAKVLKDWTGNIVGQDTSTGLSFKSPFVDSVDFDITNNLVAFVGNGETSYNGQKANGPQITFTDKDGATANIDVAVTYSINPDAVTGIFTKYQNQDNLRAKLVEQDVRSVVRTVPAEFGTLELLTNRDKLGARIQASLEEKWKGKGIIVDQVSPQEIRYSDDVKNRFGAAQSARIDNEKAKAELETATINAQQKIVQADAEAQANQKLAASLTEPILRQRYIDALSKAQFMVVPEGSNNMINVPVPVAK